MIKQLQVSGVAMSVALAGGCSEIKDEIHTCGVTSVFSVMDSPMSLEEAMRKEKALELVEKKAEQIFRLIKKFQSN